jgi:hypothetical protein
VWRWQGKTAGGFGFALIFWFFCIKAKEQKKILWLQQWNFYVLVPGFDFALFQKS